MASISISQPVHFGETREPTYSGTGDLWAELTVVSDGTSQPPQPKGTILGRQTIHLPQPSLEPGPFRFGPSMVWSSGGGAATVNLFVFSGYSKHKVLATTRFEVLP